MQINWVIGNWKMNLDNELAASLLDELAEGLRHGAPKNASVGICPPDLWLNSAVEKLDELATLGGQNISMHENGAHTGDISASMLTSCGARLIIVGHSERRSDHDETDAIVAAKMRSALAWGLTPVVCIGESLVEREAKYHIKVVEQQLQSIIEENGTHAFDNTIIAYEPIWSIGTGLTPTESDVHEVHTAIIDKVTSFGKAPSVLYGGSVKAKNAVSLAQVEGVSGFLVGGASLFASEFLEISRAFD